jgi:hypothetical protein
VVRRHRPVVCCLYPVPYPGKKRRGKKTAPGPLVGPALVPRRQKSRRQGYAGLLSPPHFAGRHRKIKGAQTGLPPPVGQGRPIALVASVGTVLSITTSAGNVYALVAMVQTTFNLVTGVSVQANIPFFVGEDLTLNFTLVPLTDITGWTFQSTVKNKLGGTTQFSPTVSITDAGRGKFQAVWPRASTSALAPGDYVWDVRRIDSGFNTVLAHGEATSRQPVTP